MKKQYTVHLNENIVEKFKILSIQKKLSFSSFVEKLMIKEMEKKDGKS